MFVTTQEADEYILTKPDCEKWFELNEEQKRRLLEEATRRIECIPMINIPDEITTDLKMACSEVAFSLFTLGTNNAHAKNIQNGITSISFGNDSVSYGQNARAEDVYLTDYAKALLRRYIAKGAKIV